MNVGRLLRITGALVLLIGGLIHLQLYFDGYRSIDSIGRSFLLNAIASGLIAAVLACRTEWFVKLAGIGVAAGTIGAFILSRQGTGLFNFREHGLEPSPQATIALIVEIMAIALVGATFSPRVADRDASSPTRRLVFALAVSTAALVGLGALWSGQGTKVVTVTANDVSVADFAFAPPSLTVATGTTVVWTNIDAFDHSIVAGDKSFRSDSIGQGETFSFVFATEGTFSYTCGIHPSMRGTIIVSG